MTNKQILAALENSLSNYEPTVESLKRIETTVKTLVAMLRAECED